jgi:hypothetical protein
MTERPKGTDTAEHPDHPSPPQDRPSVYSKLVASLAPGAAGFQ